MKLHICSHYVSIRLTPDSWSSTLPQSPRHFPDSETHKSLAVPVCKRAHMHVYTHTQSHLCKTTHTLPAPYTRHSLHRATQGNGPPKVHDPPDMPTEHRPEDLTPSLGVEGRCLPPRRRVLLCLAEWQLRGRWRLRWQRLPKGLL